MNREQIIKRVNTLLAGELLDYIDLEIHLDQVIDDINSELNTKYPVFSEFTLQEYPDKFPDYDFFPEKYVRNVIPVGVASYFYITDEEGIETATEYKRKYDKVLFEMIRDFTEYVPDEWKDDKITSLDLNLNKWTEPDPIDFWSL